MLPTVTAATPATPTAAADASSLAAAEPAGTSSSAPPPPSARHAAVVHKAPSKARWGLLKRALVKSAAASDADTNGDDASSSSKSSSTAASVRRHRGFKVLSMRELQGDELLRLRPPSFSAATDRSKYLFVQYQLPALTSNAQSAMPDDGAVAASAIPSSESSAAAASAPTLLFRIRRAGSVSLAELAPDQKIDNTGNICIWNSEEVLTHVALKLLAGPRMNHQPTAAAAATGFELPASLFASTQPSGHPLRILELGAGMSGLCGLAIAYGSATASSSHTIGEVLITDGNEACVEGIRYQLAWNAQQQQQKQAAASPASSASSSSSSSTPRISAQVLAWDRNADYSSLGKFDLILAADCLFFRDFHLDLCHVLRSLLQPDTGRAWLLAPTRGGSLHTFASLIDKQEAEQVQGLRAMQQLERYDESIWTQHESFMREEAEAAAAAAASAGSAVAPSSYSVDLHYPLLLNIQFSSSVAASSASA